MPRIARVVIPNLPHHITQRGARKQQTFFREHDYRLYVELLSKAIKKAGVEIWAYCLMPNHVHIVAVPGKRGAFGRLFRTVHSEYARHINRREGWQGHLWQERYHSAVMDESHLLAAVRYVELNPVRAALCDRPTDWRWSSVHAHLAGADDKLVTVSAMQDRIVDWPKYLSVADSDADLDKIRRHTLSGQPIGDPMFLHKIEQLTGRELAAAKPTPSRK